MSFVSTLRGMVRRSRRGREAAHPRSRCVRRRWRLAVEALEDRLCLSGNLIVSSFDSNSVLDYDGTQGTFLQTFTSGGPLATPIGLALGPNGDVFISGRGSNNVLRYDGNTGAFVGTFVAPNSGGLDGPHDLTFGPDGNLYVNSGNTASVLRYDGTSGAFLSTFVSPGSGGLGFPHGLTFGPDGNLYVGDRNTSSVLRYNRTTGAFLNAFVPSGSGGLNVTTGLTFGPDGNLYVDSFATNSVLRYDGTTGAFLGTFASGGGLNGPQGLAFGPDGNLYVSSFNSDQVLRYDGTTGAFIDVFASAGGLGGPTYLLFRRTDTTTTLNASTNPVVFGQPATFSATVSPVVATAGVPTGTVTFTIDGIAQSPIALSNGQAALSVPTLSVGNHVVTAAYNADEGFSASASGPLNEAVNKAGTTIVISASPLSSVFGQPVTFTAAVGVVAPGAGTPGGTVTFSLDGTAQAPRPLSNGKATFTTSALGVGSHTITASYNGDGNDNSSSSANFSQAVNRASTTTTLGASLASSVFGQPVTFTATVAAQAPGAGTCTGTVTLTLDGTAQTPVGLTNGQATFTTSGLGAGGHTITAVYSGDANFNTSSSTSSNLAVNKASTSIFVGTSAASAVFGQLVTFTVSLSVSAPGTGTPSSTVTFAIDGTAQTPVPLSNGQANLSTASLPVGSHHITATYSGDANYSASTAVGVDCTITPASAPLALSSSAAPSVFGQAVTFTATVGTLPQTTGTHAGKVIFIVDDVVQPPVPLLHGQATLTTRTLGVGTHTIKASLSTDGKTSFGTPVTLKQTVNKAGTTPVVHAFADASVLGQLVIFWATVSPVKPGAGTPKGTVTFTVDGSVQATVPLVDGLAVFTTSKLAVGSHVITVNYRGDSNFTGGTSVPLVQKVDPDGHKKTNHQEGDDAKKGNDGQPQRAPGGASGAGRLWEEAIAFASQAERFLEQVYGVDGKSLAQAHFGR